MIMKNYYSRRKNAINIIKVIAFTAVFIILLQSISVLVFPNKTAVIYSNKKRDAYSFINEPRNTIQIAAVGNSNLYSGFSPIDFWKKQRITSVVCASAGQTVKESRLLIDQLFQYQKPKLVLIEADMIYGYSIRSKNDVNSINSLNEFFTKMNPDLFKQDVENIFTVFKYHNCIRGKHNKNGVLNTYGYKYNSKKVPLKSNKYMIPCNTVEPISDYVENQLDLLIKKCKENNSDVLIVAMPAASSWDYERHNAIKKYASKSKVPFIDLNLHCDEIGIDMKNCYRDKGIHLNYKGAKAATEFLGKYICSQYRINPCSDAAIKNDWDNNCAAFELFRNKHKPQKDITANGQTE